jgi:hypothetical protein
MNIEHFVCLSWFRAISERHEQDGKTLSRAHSSCAERTSVLRSCHGVSNLAWRGWRPHAVIPLSIPAALVAAG